jgi:hypothetical protein
MKTLLSLLILGFSMSALAATSVVEGTVAKVVKEKKEIYVTSKDDGKKYEYYFHKGTKLTKAGADVAFDLLVKDQKVKVTADKKGKRLDPQHVEILE